MHGYAVRSRGEKTKNISTAPWKKGPKKSALNKTGGPGGKKTTIENKIEKENCKLNKTLEG